jgi:hypothetical protein
MFAPSRVPEGILLRALAAVHALVGLIVFRRELGVQRRRGFLGRVPIRGSRATPFWFLLASPLVWVIGGLIGEAEEREDWPALRRAHEQSLAAAVLCCLCLPVSGFWGWLLISWRGLRHARQGERARRTS